MENPLTAIEAHKRRVNAMNDALEIPADGMALNLLQAVYRNSALDLSLRMRAAALAIGYESPKLLATAIVNEQSFAELLDRRLARIKPDWMDVIWVVVVLWLLGGGFPIRAGRLSSD